MKRKLLVVLLSLAMLLTFTPMTAFADETVEYPCWDETHTHYLLDANDNVAKGITPIGDDYYYFDEEDGTLQEGQPFSVEKYEDEFYYYYTDENGVLQNGWKTNEEGDTYYFQTSDDMAPFEAYTSRQMVVAIDDEPYFFDDYGALYYGLFERPYWTTNDDGEEVIGGYDHYYADEETGILQTGWQTIDGDDYYFYPDNYFAAADGRYELFEDGVYYTFDEDGVLTDVEDTNEPEIKLVPFTAWVGCEYGQSIEFTGALDETDILDVWVEDTDIIDVVCHGDENDIWDYDLQPLEAGETELYVTYALDDEEYTISTTITAKEFPAFITKLVIDGEEEDPENYAINYYDIYNYDGTAPSVAFTLGEDWYLDNAYGFWEGESEDEGGNIEINTEDGETEWTFDFPENGEDLYTFYYFKNDLNEEIMYSVRFHRGAGDEPYYPPAGGHWDATHTHYYYEDGEMAKGRTWLWDEDAGEDYLYYFDEKDGHVRTGWIKNAWEYYDEEEDETYSGVEWYYAGSDGKCLEGWQKISNKWYYFETDGCWMYSGGVREIGDNSYYFNDSGVMQTGWIKDAWKYYDEEDDETYSGVNWYYANSSGVLQSGWQKISSKWYYFYPDWYEMATGRSEIDGKYYFFNDSGAMQTGWVKAEYNTWDHNAGPKAKYIEWFYANSSGVLQSGWQKISGNWYYFDPEWNGMSTGVTEIDEKAYFFNESGLMQTGWIKREWGDGSADWYYADSSGVLAQGWKKISGKWYYFDYFMYTGYHQIDGKDYFFNASGAMVSNPSGWLKNAYGGWYYFKSGKPVTGWQKISGKWYYFGSDPEYPVMRKGYADIDGKDYFFDKSGIWVSNPSGWQGDEYGNWFYFKNGTACRGWLKISNKWYYFGKEYPYMYTGLMNIDDEQYFFNTSGVWVSKPSGWQKDKYGGWYYFKSGKLATGWQKIDGKWYYFDPYGGWMYTGWNQIDEKWYYFNSSGVMQTGKVTTGGYTYNLGSSGAWDGK